MKLSPLALKDLWLSSVNPLRGLTMSRVVGELESGERGDYSMLQWLYRFIEKRDATLRGAKRRLRSSVLKLDWNVKIVAAVPAGLEEIAKQQQAKLKADYDRLENLKAALAHLVLSEFRGYSHVQKEYDAAGNVVRLEPVPQWHWCRDGLYGAWLFKEDAGRGGINGEPVDLSDFIVREVEDPINEIAVIAFVRKSLSDKDWDGFVARFGIPFIYWMLSDAMAAAVANDPNKMNEYLATMRGIGSDGEGIFPGGTLETLDSSGGSGQTPFEGHLKHQDEKIVMAATSGKLTMLNEATGLGSGNSDAHSDTFDEIALALAVEISEVMQAQFDKPILEAAFPGQPILAYFELAAKDEDDISQVTTHAKTLSDAGYQIDVADLSERTSYKLALKATAPAAPPVTLPVKSFNRAKPSGPVDEAAVRKTAAALLQSFSDLSVHVLSAPVDDSDPSFLAAVLKGAES